MAYKIIRGGDDSSSDYAVINTEHITSIAIATWGFSGSSTTGITIRLSSKEKFDVDVQKGETPEEALLRVCNFLLGEEVTHETLGAPEK